MQINQLFSDYYIQAVVLLFDLVKLCLWVNFQTYKLSYLLAKKIWGKKKKVTLMNWMAEGVILKRLQHTHRNIEELMEVPVLTPVWVGCWGSCNAWQCNHWSCSGSRRAPVLLGNEGQRGCCAGGAPTVPASLGWELEEPGQGLPLLKAHGDGGTGLGTVPLKCHSRSQPQLLPSPLWF